MEAERAIAPDVFRQRLLIEGYWTIGLDRDVIDRYLRDIAAHLGLTIYGDPIVYAPEGKGRAENQGFDAFVPLVDSGISAYFWSAKRFFSILLYTCSRFDERAAAAFTREFFGAEGGLHTLSF